MEVGAAYTVGAGSDLPLFTDLGLLPYPITQVVELGPADVAAANDLDAFDDRRVQREGPFHADPEADLPDGE